MSERNKSEEPMYSDGAKLIALGEALQDKRTRISDLAELAFECGMRLTYSFGKEKEKEST